jgi:hypothetical protein
MLKKKIALAGALGFVMLATPVLPPAVQAQPASSVPVRSVCLVYSRIASWHVVSPHYLLVVDRDGRPFTAHLTDGCQALTNETRGVNFRPTNDVYSCLRDGAIIAYRDPNAGRQSCMVETVRPGFPEGFLHDYEE